MIFEAGSDNDGNATYSAHPFTAFISTALEYEVQQNIGIDFEVGYKSWNCDGFKLGLFCARSELQVLIQAKRFADWALRNVYFRGSHSWLNLRNAVTHLAELRVLMQKEVNVVSQAAVSAAYVESVRRYFDRSLRERSYMSAVAEVEGKLVPLTASSFIASRHPLLAVVDK